MTRPLRRHDLVLDAEGRWCMVLDPGPVVAAYCPALGRRVVLEAPVHVVADPLAFLRVQETSPLVEALLAWHACGGIAVPRTGPGGGAGGPGRPTVNGLSLGRWASVT